MKCFLAAILMLTLLTLVVSDHNAAATGGVETAFSSQFTGCGGVSTDRTLLNSAGIYLLADADSNGNGEENGETKEKDLEADPAGGVDRIWNSVQLA